MPDGSIDVRGGFAQHTDGLQPRRGRTPRLPDQLTINFGPVERIGRFLLRADQQLREHGIRVSLNFDFEELEATRARIPGKFGQLPIYKPSSCTLGAQNAFWLKGVNASGETVLMHAVRHYVWSGTSLKEELESLRAFYDVIPPLPTRAVVTSPSASKISGRVGIMGSLWLHPDFRGGGLASTISPLTRTVALARWYPDFTCSFLWSQGAEKMAAIYGWPAANVEVGLEFFNLTDYQGPEKIDGTLCYATRGQMEDTVLQATMSAALVQRTQPMEAVAAGLR